MCCLTLRFLGSFLGSLLCMGVLRLFGYQPIVSVGWDLLLFTLGGVALEALVFQGFLSVGLVSRHVYKP